MSDSETDTYTVSFKTSTGYDASLIVVRGDDVVELADNINSLHENIVSLVVETENLVHSAYAALSGAPAPAPAAAAPAASAATDATVTPLMTCAHGKRQRRQSKPGAARQWVGYFCPQPKGQPQCDPVWED